MRKARTWYQFSNQHHSIRRRARTTAADKSTQAANPHPGATEATIQSLGTYPPGEDPRRWRVLGVILTTIFMSLISVSIINVALPSIQQGLDATESDIQ